MASSEFRLFPATLLFALRHAHSLAPHDRSHLAFSEHRSRPGASGAAGDPLVCAGLYRRATAGLVAHRADAASERAVEERAVQRQAARDGRRHRRSGRLGDVRNDPRRAARLGSDLRHDPVQRLARCRLLPRPADGLSHQSHKDIRRLGRRDVIPWRRDRRDARDRTVRAAARACASADRRSGLCGAADRTIFRAHRQFHHWRIVGQADRCALGNGVSARARSPAAPSQPALRSGVGRHPAVRDFADGHSRLSLAGPAGPDERCVPHRLWDLALRRRRQGDVVRVSPAESEGGVNALSGRIARLIASQGPISIAQFMTMALHDPQDGYYATRDPFGRGGDFTTAPEISQMFGELLGLWCVQCWHDQGKPAPAQLVELGPGRGTLMADALRAAKLMPDFLASIEVVLVEASPALTAIQKETLKDSPAPVRWLTQFDERLSDRPLFLLANEFFDALPIRQFVKTDRGWCERMVGLDTNGVLAFALAPEPSAGFTLPPNRDGAPLGAFYEAASGASALAEQIAEIIARRGGAALIVDYGYGVEAGFGVTLQAVKDHAFAGVLDSPGEADLSAHIDFAALADAARSGGAKGYGPVEQGEFLTSLGIIPRAERLAQQQASGSRECGHLGDSPQAEAQLERLILPDQMGTLFKALAIMPANAPKPPRF